MNAMLVIGMIASVIYGVLVDGTWFKIYFILLFSYYVLTQIGRANKQNTRRTKINIATWNAPCQPIVNFTTDWDFANAKAFIEKTRKQSGKNITITHVCAAAIGRALRDEPQWVGKIWCGNVYH
jgi:hypothetical protein